MAFDGIVTKAIASELQQLSGARIDKIFQPNANNIILGFYLDGFNYALNIVTHPSNYRIHLTTHPKANPKVAPNFCMVLRKHLVGLRIKNIITNHLERIVIIELEGFNDIDDILTKKLIIELMGKHCNIVLLDDQNIIIDSLRHIHHENSTHRVVPHIPYTYPKVSKLNFLDCTDLEDFKKTLSTTSLDELPTKISHTYNGISKNLVKLAIEKLGITNLQELYHYLRVLLDGTDSFNLKFETYDNDYFLVPFENADTFSLNFFVDNFYYEKEMAENFKTARNNLLKLILSTLKKYQKRLSHINEKLTSCEHMDMYQLYGELITANLYRIKNENISQIELENYYDNNKVITIPLDSRYTPSVNAKKYFKKYHKLKNALEVVTLQKKETLQELDYIESIVYELEAATSLAEISEISDEISENVIFKDKTDSFQKKKSTRGKKSNFTKNKKVTFHPFQYSIGDFTLLVGRNNQENDYLTLKYAHKTDLWFHTKDIHGSHAILVLNGKIPKEDVLVKCAEITAYHSKARLSSKVPVDLCQVRYVKKPKGSKPGRVIYTDYSTLYVNPKND
ncbi:MAG: fibronectin/fibrinogen-binding protein [Clostridia bacterium]|nr:fibronectin/fibrinogen-binding protein [Clostridia bacterium]